MPPDQTLQRAARHAPSDAMFLRTTSCPNMLPLNLAMCSYCLVSHFAIFCLRYLLKAFHSNELAFDLVAGELRGIALVKRIACVGSAKIMMSRPSFEIARPSGGPYKAMPATSGPIRDVPRHCTGDISSSGVGPCARKITSLAVCRARSTRTRLAARAVASGAGSAAPAGEEDKLTVIRPGGRAKRRVRRAERVAWRHQREARLQAALIDAKSNRRHECHGAICHFGLSQRRGRCAAQTFKSLDPFAGRQEYKAQGGKRTLTGPYSHVFPPWHQDG